MPLPTTKIELLTNLDKSYNKLNAEFSSVSTQQERLADIEGDISCCDIIAYQIGWGKLLLNWDKQELIGEQPIMPAQGYKWNQLGALAQSFYRQYNQLTLSELLLEFNSLYQQLVTWIKQC